MNNKTFLFTVSIFFILIGCKDKPVQKNENFKFSSYESKDTIFLFDNKEMIGSVLDISFIYPETQNEKDSIQSVEKAVISLFFGEEYANQAPNIAIKQYLKRFHDKKSTLESEYSQLREYAKEDKLEVRKDLGYSISIKDSVLYNDNNILSLLITTNSYSGGAHGMMTKKVYTITQKGKIIKENDIFNEGYTDALKNALIEKLLVQNKAKDLNELSELGFIFTEGIVPNGNFFISEKGITYIYGAYEIACYAIGICEVFLSFEEIRFLLKKESPISSLL